MMNKYAILCLALAFSLTGIVLATSVCNNAPCEKMINASVGKNFEISLESSPTTGFQWWTNFNPEYMILVNDSFVQNSAAPGMVGVPGKETFTFTAKKAGETDIIMLSLQPWENGTIGQRKIFPITIT